MAAGHSDVVDTTRTIAHLLKTSPPAPAALTSEDLPLTLVAPDAWAEFNGLPALSAPRASVGKVSTEPKRRSEVESTDSTKYVNALIEAKRALRGAYRMATIMFVDMAGSTLYTDRFGNMAGLEKTVIHNREASRVIEQLAGVAAKRGEIARFAVCNYIGDAVMAWFDGPRSSKVAVQAAGQIMQTFEGFNKGIKDDLAKFASKIAIDAGEVAFVRYLPGTPEDPQGLAVNRAAKIATVARPGQILVSEFVRVGSQDSGFDSGEEVTLDLPGTGPTLVSEVNWEKGLIGIVPEQPARVHTIKADPHSVAHFVLDGELLNSSSQIDLYCYSFETFLFSMRGHLHAIKGPLNFRVLVRNPAKDPSKRGITRDCIQMAEGIADQRKSRQGAEPISFTFKAYDHEPLLRLYVFWKTDGLAEALAGMYWWDKGSSPRKPRFVGADDNFLVHLAGRSTFEDQFLDIILTRFEYSWARSKEIAKF